MPAVLALIPLLAAGFTCPTVAAPAATSRHTPASMNLFAGLQQGIAKAMAGDYDEAAVKANVERMIKMKPAIMFGTSTCPFVRVMSPHRCASVRPARS